MSSDASSVSSEVSASNKAVAVDSIKEQNLKLARENEVLLREKERRLEKKREYDRVNAARARKRVKAEMEHLRTSLDEATSKNQELEKGKVDLEHRVASLENENKLLKSILLGGNKQNQQGQACGVADQTAQSQASAVAPQQQHNAISSSVGSTSAATAFLASKGLLAAVLAPSLATTVTNAATASATATTLSPPPSPVSNQQVVRAALAQARARAKIEQLRSSMGISLY